MFATQHAVSRRTVITLCALLGACIVATLPSGAQAQTAPSISGDYTGTLGPLHLRLHLKTDASGTLSGSIDSPNQGANGLACADFKVQGEALSFSVPIVHGTWKGTVSADAKTLTGTWDQGNPMPLVFTRDTFVAAEKPSRVDGIWLGGLQAGDASPRTSAEAGTMPWTKRRDPEGSLLGDWPQTATLSKPCGVLLSSFYAQCIST